MLSYDMTMRGELGLYEFLYRCIRDDIIAGRLAPDDRLPSKRSFAEHIGVSLITVEGAYGQLVAEGYIHSSPRRGYYVSQLPELSPSIQPRSAQRTTVPTGKTWSAVHRSDTVPIADLADPTSNPDPAIARLWSRALRATIVQESETELYAPQPAKGAYRARRAIAEYLASSRGMTVDPDRIVIGAGAQVLYIMIAMLMGPESLVAIEDPGYPRLQDVYRSCGLDTVAIPLDGDGISMDRIGESDPKVVHIMPSHQFPTGLVTSISRRYELLGWASREAGRHIVEDDYDWEFRLSGKPIPSLQSIDTLERVIYLSTFTKSLGPALRMAFAVLPERLADRFDSEFGFLSSTVSTIDQTTLARLLESGDYERHLGRYRKKSRDTRDKLIEAILGSSLGDRVAIEEADSGLHFILALESREPDTVLAQRSALEGMLLSPLSDYRTSSEPQVYRDGRARFVIRYDGICAESIDDAVEVLEKVL